jgi:hypothetical protein
MTVSRPLTVPFNRSTFGFKPSSLLPILRMFWILGTVWVKSSFGMLHHSFAIRHALLLLAMELLASFLQKGDRSILSIKQMGHHTLIVPQVCQRDDKTHIHYFFISSIFMQL